ncbi:Metal transporter Nramp5 [Morella rubra]|uniref:Metal transporter Nramp5 n=1 Tax=Morella rubra TaxID=262757 RepID=A0A6A1W9L7_9ROSI|nr:Metal transporter Nramp5 [Morella rubra]
MGSLEQQQQQVNGVVPSSLGGGSNRMAAIKVEREIFSPSIDMIITDKQFDQDIEDSNHQKFGWRKFLSYVGLGFLVSLAYLDPGNLETDLQAGASHRYELLWVVLIGMIFALIIQSLAANLGVSTGKHLSELCKVEYPRYAKYCLWLLAEVAVIAADIPEVIGTAFALNILFYIPVWAGVLLTGLSTLLLLGLQRYGVRKLEMLIAVLVFVMAACFFREMSYVKPPADEVLKGMFIPKLKGQGATGDAIALLGALIMPKIPTSVRGVNSFSVSGTVCTANSLSTENVDRCNDLNLNSASFLLKGFLDLKMKKWTRNLMIRCIAITPSLIVSIISGSSGAGQLIIIASIIVISWILGLGIIGINIYYLSTGFVDWLINNNLPKVANVFVGVLVFPIMAVYILAVIYLTFRKDRVVTFVQPIKNDLVAQNKMENGLSCPDGPTNLDQIPYREDLADIPLTKIEGVKIECFTNERPPDYLFKRIYGFLIGTTSTTKLYG